MTTEQNWNAETASLKMQEVQIFVMTASREKIVGLACPFCGGPMKIFFMRSLMPFLGWTQLNIDCVRDYRCFTMDSSCGKIKTPPWFKGLLWCSIVTQPSQPLVNTRGSD